MANLLRLIVAALLLVGASAFAGGIVPSVIKYGHAYAPNYPFSSGSAACSDLASKVSNVNTTYTGSWNGTSCYLSASTGGGLNGQIYQQGGLCPANSTKVGTDCVCGPDFEAKDGQCRPLNPCPAGQHEEGGACVPDACQPNEVRVNGVCVKEPDCPPGETRVNGVCKKNGCEPGKSLGDYETNGESTTFYCEPYGGKNCTVRVNPGVCVTVDGVASCWGTGRMTGATCTPGNGNGDSGNGPGQGPGGDGGGTGGDGPGNGGNGPGTGDNDGPGTGPTTPPVSPPPPVPPDPNTGKCPPGTERYPNGNCYAPTPPPTNPDDDGKCPAGKVKVGDKCVSPSPPGKPVPDTGTPDNPNPVGGGGGNGDGDGDGDGDSMFTGSCMGGFTCEGDAIQCAMAREQHRRACTFFEDKTPETELYATESVKTGNRTADLPGNSTHDFGPGMYDSSNMLPAASCIADVTVEVVSTSVTLPFSRVCPLLGYFRLALLAFGALAWVFIVFRV